MRITLCALALLVAGCTLLTPQHDPSRFYTLSARDAASSGGNAGLSVIVGPVTVPAYLDRNEVAVRVSPTEIKYALGERWAEPLRQSFTRVLVDDLGAVLSSDRVIAMAASGGVKPDYWIEVVVVRCETDVDGKAELTARWAVRDAAGKVVRVRQSQHVRQAAAATTEGGVSALSAALGDLADEISTVLREIRGER
jgi:hypothetical protein